MGFPGQPYGQGRPDGRGVSESPGRPPGESVSGQPGEPGFPADPGYAGDAGHPAEAGAAQAGYQPASYQQTPGYPAGHDNRQWSGRVNGMAIAALVCGIAQFLLWFFLLVPGFIVALMALIFGLAWLRSSGAARVARGWRSPGSCSAASACSAAWSGESCSPQERRISTITTISRPFRCGTAGRGAARGPRGAACRPAALGFGPGGSVFW